MQPALFAAALLASGCSLVPVDGERLRIEEVKNAILPMASVAVDTGQLETAARLYQRLLDVSPDSFEGHMGLGDVAFKARRSAEAARWYLGALTTSRTPEERHEALLWHGRAALEAGLLEESRRSFAQLAEAGEQAPPKSVAWGFNGVGLTRLLEGDLPGAVAAMRAAVRHAPNEPMFAENLDRAVAMLGEQERRPPVGEQRPRTVAGTPQPTVSELMSDAPPAGPPAALPASPSVELALVETATAPPEPATAPDETIAETPVAQATAEATAEVTAEETAAGEGAATADPAPSTVEWLDEQLDSEFQGHAAASEATAPVAAAAVVRVGQQSFVQVGAFEELAAADAEAARLADATGADTFVALSRSLYRVRIGPLDSEAALAAVATALEDVGHALADAPMAGDVGEAAGDEDGLAGRSVDAAASAVDSADSTTPNAVAAQGVVEDAEEAGAEHDLGDEPAGGRAPTPAANGFLVEEGGQRFVQLGAFLFVEKARDLASRLRELTTESVRIDTVQRGGETLHRVRVGPLETDAALVELAAATRTAGYTIE